VVHRKLRTDHCLSAFPVQALWTIPILALQDFSSDPSAQSQAAHSKRLSGLSLPSDLIPVPPRESVAMHFLNCTKNTELTSHLFARTFDFVLS
jgi:hypothetical protein